MKPPLTLWNVARSAEIKAWRAAHPPTKRTVRFGWAVNKWLVKEAKRRKCTVPELIRNIVHETSGHF